MNPILEKALLEAGPNVYGYRQTLVENRPPVAFTLFSFECSDGWFGLLFELTRAIDGLGVTAVQVKEKFGTLRFYLDHYTEEADALIGRAEKRSSVECEECGAAGKARSPRGWIRTLCDYHAEENDQ